MIEDEIRRIAREEIARLFPQHREQLIEPQEGIYRGLPKSLFEPPRTPEDDIDDVLYASKPIVPRYDPPAAERRTGCTCPPGAQTSCPDKACPWKPA